MGAQRRRYRRRVQSEAAVSTARTVWQPCKPSAVPPNVDANARVVVAPFKMCI